MKSKIVTALLASLLAFFMASNAAGQSSIEQTGTGFYWPTGTSSINLYAGWLSSGCSGNTSYDEGKFHIGEDIKATLNDPVYAIADGTVIWISENGWGEGNKAVLVDHQLDDKTHFIAIYGHVIPKVGIHQKVTGGEVIATIGSYSPTHLHFGILPGFYQNAPNGPYGKMPCPPTGPITNTNGFVPPIEWIQTKAPLLQESTYSTSFYAIIPLRNIWVRASSQFELRIDNQLIMSEDRPSDWSTFTKQAVWVFPFTTHNVEIRWWKIGTDPEPQFFETWWPNNIAFGDGPIETTTLLPGTTATTVTAIPTETPLSTFTISTTAIPTATMTFTPTAIIPPGPTATNAPSPTSWIPTAPIPESPPSGTSFAETDYVPVDICWSNTDYSYYGEIWGGPSTITFGPQSNRCYHAGLLPAGYTYYWHVKTWSGLAESPWSNTWSVTVRLAPPSSVGAIANSCHSVGLSWDDRSTSEDGYKIYRDGSLVGAVGSNVTYYLDDGVSPGTHTYSVVAYRGSMESDAETSSVTVDPCSVAPAAFGKSSPSNGTTGLPAILTLSWGSSSNGLITYEYCVDPTNNNVCDGGWGSTPSTSTSYGTDPSRATTYYWQVRARNTFGTTEADNGTWWSFTVSP